MLERNRLSRRGFVGGVATAIGYLSFKSPRELFAQARGGQAGMMFAGYDDLAHLSSNENPYGPSELVVKAMTQAFKYANRYGYPDGDVQGAIAEYHGVKRENILIGAGSGEILDVVGSAYGTGKKVVGVEPSYSQVYGHVTGMKGEAITLPLTKDFRQDIPSLVHAVKQNYREVGFVYICNPNNPTGRIVTKDEIKQLLDGIPEDVPVLIDEAYHHFVEDPAYGTSIPHAIDGRSVIVARTFSKIAGLAGMRLGYAIAPAPIIKKMQPYSTGTVNASVKFGAIAALKDTATEAQVKKLTLENRKKTVAELESLGYSVIPSEANFFMVHLKRDIRPVIQEFRKQNVAVGRPFPPMTEHLRVSIGTADEMKRFMVAFKDIMSKPPVSTVGGSGK